MQWPIPPFPTRASVGGEVNVQTGATANTKGSWITLISGIPAPGAWINLATDRFTTAGDRAILVDIGIGDAGSETVIAPDLIMGNRDYRGTLFPLHIPAGATVRARASAQLTSQFVRIRTHILHGEPDCGLSVPGRVTPYGTVPASSGGINVTPSGTSNVKGSYTELTAATTAPIHALMVLVQGISSLLPNMEYLIDIAVGPAGSETVVIPDFAVWSRDDEIMHPRSPEFWPLSVCLPAGVRLAARCLAVNNTSTTAIEVAVYGFTY
ncbi:hypothetical protein [Nonomuraea sp. 10N515B]|uniref:hypothetical protein n=1 Tax=Nonomuraea sp. 10N515B TaxID=3457422 RepID=UPI003FCD9252